MLLLLLLLFLVAPSLVCFPAPDRYDCVYVGAGCDPDLTLPYLKGLLNVGGVMVAPFREELIRMEVLT